MFLRTGSSCSFRVAGQVLRNLLDFPFSHNARCEDSCWDVRAIKIITGSMRVVQRNQLTALCKNSNEESQSCCLYFQLRYRLLGRLKVRPPFGVTFKGGRGTFRGAWSKTGSGQTCSKRQGWLPHAFEEAASQFGPSRASYMRRSKLQVHRNRARTFTNGLSSTSPAKVIPFGRHRELNGLISKLSRFLLNLFAVVWFGS